MTQIYLNIISQGIEYKVLVLEINRKFIRTHSGINFANHSVHLQFSYYFLTIQAFKFCLFENYFLYIIHSKIRNIYTVSTQECVERMDNPVSLLEVSL